MSNLKSTIRLYFDTILEDQTRVFKELIITEFDEDEDVEVEKYREGDFASCKLSNNHHGSNYIQVKFFIEVSRDNDDQVHTLCVRNRYQVLEGETHATGYTVMKNTNEVFVCLAEFVELRAHIVPCFDQNNIYLLNDDINRKCWSSIEIPLLPTIRNVVDWSTDSGDNDGTDNESEAEDEDGDDEDEDGEEEDDEEDDDEDDDEDEDDDYEEED
ncbi:unnamed protein product [Mucor hiemalis]